MFKCPGPGRAVLRAGADMGLALGLALLSGHLSGEHSSHRTFNNKLKWTNHMDNLTKGVKSMCDVLNRLKHSLSRSTLEVIYFTFVRPKLEYACIVFDDCTENEKNKLESIQLYCASIVTGAKRGTSHALLYNELNWPKLSERRKIAKCKFAYNLSNQNVPDYLSELMPHKVCQQRKQCKALE